MSHMQSHDEPFVPEHVDEQIKALSQEYAPADTYVRSTSNEVLVHTLRRMYTAHSLSNEDRASLESVRQKLRQRAAQIETTPSTQPSAHANAGIAAGPLVLDISDRRSTSRNRPRAISPWLVTLVAVLIIGILGGGLLFFVNNGHQQAATSTAKSAVQHPQDVYTTYNQILYKIDGSNGHVLWQQKLASWPLDKLLIQNNQVYVTLDQGIYVYNATTGHADWHQSVPANTSNTSHVVVDGQTLYVEYLDGTLAAFSTKDGTQLWHSPQAYAKQQTFSVKDGTLYTVSNITGSESTILHQYLCALNGATGQLRWQTEIAPGGAVMVDLVSNGVLYHANGSYLYALNVQNGDILWHKYSNDVHATFFQLYLNQGVVYTETVSTGIDPTIPPQGYIYAFQAKDGTPLWSISNEGLLSPQGDIGFVASTSLPALNGTLFVNSTQKYAHTFSGISIKNGSTVWRANFSAASVEVTTEASLVDGKVYIVTRTPTSQADHLLVVDASNAHLLANRSLPIGLGRSDVSMNQSQLIVGTNSGNNTMKLTSIRLTDGKVLWQKSFTGPDTTFYTLTQAP